MPTVGNLIHMTSTTGGTGNLTVTSVSGKRDFDDEFGTGGTDVFDYFISNSEAAEWERGTGHMQNTTTFVRDTVLESSNSDALVNFTASNTLNITNDVPAAKQVQTDATQTLTNKTMDAASNTIHANNVHLEVYNNSGVTLDKGDPVYISGFNVGQSLPEAELADADDSAKMPAIGLAEESISNGSSGLVTLSGQLTGLTTSSYSVGDELFVDTTVGTLTNTKPTGTTTAIQKIGIVLRSHASLGVIEVIGAGRSNDIPNAVSDDRFKIHDNLDNTKLVQTDASALTTATTRTVTWPDANISWSTFGAGLVGDADAATARTTLGAAASGANTDITSVELNNTGLTIDDTDASHQLSIVPGSNLTADRQLTLTTGDAARTITINGDPTLNDWFDQSVKTTDSPTFANPQVTTIEVGHATDTTLARVSAGVASIEGNNIYTAGTDIAAADGGTIGQQTIWVPAAAMEPRVTTAAATSNAVEIGTSLLALRTMDFASDADDHAGFAIQMPKGWDEGTVIAQFVWSATGQGAGNDGVRWFIRGGAYASNDVLTTALGTAVGATAQDHSGTNDDVMITSETAAITIAGSPGAEEWVYFEVYRDVSDAGDDLDVDARLHGVKIHYTVDAGTDD